MNASKNNLSEREDNALLIHYFSLPAPAPKRDRKKQLRAMIRLNPDNSRVAKWRAKIAGI